MPPWGRGKRGDASRAGRGGNLPAQKGQRGMPPRAKGKWGGCLPMRGRKKRGCLPVWGLEGKSPKAAKVSLLDASPNGKFCRGRMGFQQAGASGGKIITG